MTVSGNETDLARIACFDEDPVRATEAWDEIRRRGPSQTAIRFIATKALSGDIAREAAGMLDLTDMSDGQLLETEQQVRQPDIARLLRYEAYARFIGRTF